MDSQPLVQCVLDWFVGIFAFSVNNERAANVLLTAIIQKLLCLRQCVADRHLVQISCASIGSIPARFFLKKTFCPLVRLNVMISSLFTQACSGKSSNPSANIPLHQKKLLFCAGGRIFSTASTNTLYLTR